MSFSFRMRPRLLLRGEASASDVLLKIDAALKAEDVPFNGYVMNDHGVIRIPDEQQHYWSPQLQFDVRDVEGATQISGRFMPPPAVWTLFAGLYGITFFLGCCGTVFGLVQLQLKHPAPWLWTFPIALCLLAFVYLAAMVGQKLGHDQMLDLKKYIQEFVDTV